MPYGYHSPLVSLNGGDPSRLGDDLPPGRRRLVGILWAAFLIGSAVTTISGVNGPLWVVFLAASLTLASLLGAMFSMVPLDIDGTADRIVADLRKGDSYSETAHAMLTAPDRMGTALAQSEELTSKRQWQISAPVDDVELFVKIRDLLQAQARQNFRWSWFFFLLGIPVGIAIQLLF